ncbi:MAG: anti-sigma F factor [Christensenellales bacterium]
MLNEMKLTIKAISQNESFARSVVSAFCVPLNLSLDELTEIKTSVSEAVTNCVVHAYPCGDGEIKINVKLFENKIYISISDDGVGIDNIEKAREPFFTTKPEEERSGMGFTVMESFMDKVDVKKNGKSGVTVVMEKYIKNPKLNALGV